jgi:hypothetical protein
MSTIAPVLSAADVDIRECSQADRQILTKGQRICIYAGEAFITNDLPLPLFIATSIKTDLLVGDRVELPAGTDCRGILILLNYLKEMVYWRKGSLRMPNTMDIYDMLNVTASAEALGMTKYVHHVYRKCEALLRNELPSYEDLDAITYFAEKHPRLLRLIASNNLAVRMREGGIPDVDEFATYLANNHILRTAIETANVKHEERLNLKQKHEKAHAIRAQHAMVSAAAAERAKAEREVWEKEQAERKKEKDAKEKAFWAKKKAEDAEDEKNIQNKLKLAVGKRKFTPREASHWRKTRGTKLPAGC